MGYVTRQRERDKAVILSVVRSFGPVSQVEIHRLTHLRASVISQLVKELLGEGSLETSGRSDNPTGRKQILLRINQEQGYLLGIEFDSDAVVAGVMNLVPRIGTLIKEPTRRDAGVAGLTSQLIRCAHRSLEQAGVPLHRLRGIGLADVGLIDRRAGASVMSSQLEFWRDVPLVQLFEEEFRTPVFLESATRCRANAERTLGAGESSDDLIYVEYGAGIGAAIFSGGRILEGRHASAGEFGHTRVAPVGPACKCGSFGCLEAVAGSPALAARFREILREAESSPALALAGGDASQVTGWDVLKGARSGNKVCLQIVEEMSRHLAIGLGNLVNLLDPARIVLDRRLEICGPEFLDQLRRAIRLQSLSHLTEDLIICYGSVGEEAGVLGAGLLCLDALFAIPELKPPRFLVEPEAVAGIGEQRGR